MTASTASREAQKQQYSEELAAYTLRQWNLLRQSMDSNSSSDIIKNNPVTSPTPPENTKTPTVEAKDTKSSSRPGQTTFHFIQPAITTNKSLIFFCLSTQSHRQYQTRLSNDTRTVIESLEAMGKIVVRVWFLSLEPSPPSVQFVIDISEHMLTFSTRSFLPHFHTWSILHCLVVITTNPCILDRLE